MTVKRIKLHRDTTAAWAAVNPVLAPGEPGVAYDPITKRSLLKLGDGITPWNDLPWFEGGSSTNPSAFAVELQRHDVTLSSAQAYVVLPHEPKGAVMVSVNGLIEHGAPVVSGKRVYLPDWVMAGDAITAIYAREAI